MKYGFRQKALASSLVLCLAAVSCSSESSSSSDATPVSSSTTGQVTTTILESSTTTTTVEETTTTFSTEVPVATHAEDELAPIPDGWEVVASFDFDGPGIPAGITVEDNSTFGDGNNEEQCYSAENTFVDAGSITLLAQETDACKDRNFQSGMIRFNDLEVAPGQVLEFVVRVDSENPEATGYWPAFWASSWTVDSDGNKIGWPGGGEIDVLELKSGAEDGRGVFRPLVSAHFKDTNGENDKVNRATFLDEPFAGEWHTFKFEYDLDGGLLVELDGEEIFAADPPTTDPNLPAPFSPDAVIGNWKFNLAVGGNNNPIDEGAFNPNVTASVSEVRVSQRTR